MSLTNSSSSNPTFGIVIACCATDIHYAKAAYASAQHYMPDLPVAFIFDGKAPASLAGLPNSVVIDFSTFPDKEVAKLIFQKRSSTTKFASFFAAPFDAFAYVDSDAVFVGDIRRQWRWDMDAVIDHPPRSRDYSEDEVDLWFFDHERIREYYPHFDWRTSAGDYFCAGAFISRPSVIKRDELIKALTIQESDRNVFKYMDQGILNFLFFNSINKGRVRIIRSHFQYIPHNMSKDFLKNTFRSAECGSLAAGCVFHFAGAKPHILQRNGWTWPMTLFRFRYLTRFQNSGAVRAALTMILEDCRFYYLKRARRAIQKTKKALTSRYARLKSR